MKQFQYVRPTEASSAISALLKDPEAKFVAGGTNLLDLMKRGVEAPERLVDINRLPLRDITKSSQGFSIGALTLNSTLAENKEIRKDLPLLSQALLAGASAQLRNMATVGGNLLQRTRCPYFYDTSMPCNKRMPGSGCGALNGFNRMHAIFGASEHCIAVNPSDMNVALTALDATIHLSGPRGKRNIPIQDFHRLPGDQPERDTVIGKNELITGISVPTSALKHVHYLKIRDRSSYAFALVSVAAALDIRGNTIRKASLAMGGVAHKPWRLAEVENFLAGKQISANVFQEAGTLAMRGARAYEHNEFKLKLGPLSIGHALSIASGLVKA
ncbi:FAD binding domain-containing protein [Arcticibacter sp.]|uniref:FAD binding domain-containing protein n=1 Tax=Arcticibacter sp. TaxID=1872630 RepID=UPI00388F7670